MAGLRTTVPPLHGGSQKIMHGGVRLSVKI